MKGTHFSYYCGRCGIFVNHSHSMPICPGCNNTCCRKCVVGCICLDCFKDMSPEYQEKYKKAYKLRVGIIYLFIFLMFTPLIIGFLIGVFNLAVKYPIIDTIGYHLLMFSPFAFLLFLITICTMKNFHSKYYTLGTTAAIQAISHKTSHSQASAPYSSTLKPSNQDAVQLDPQNTYRPEMQQTHRSNTPNSAEIRNEINEKVCPKCEYRVAAMNPICPNCLYHFNQKEEEDI